MRFLTASAAVLALLVVADATARVRQGEPASLVQRFLARAVRTPSTYRAKRRLEAANLRFKKSAWLETTTEITGSEFTFVITDRGGSEFIQKRALIPVLEAERDLEHDGGAFAISEANYRFEETGPAEDGSPRLRLLPRRKDKRLVDGFLVITPDGDLTEISGKLAKSPSFWTTSVAITRRYAHIGGVRVPVSITSVAEVRLAGRSSFSMTYEFERIDGMPVIKASYGGNNALSLGSHPAEFSGFSRMQRDTTFK